MDDVRDPSFRGVPLGDRMPNFSRAEQKLVNCQENVARLDKLISPSEVTIETEMELLAEEVSSITYNFGNYRLFAQTLGATFWVAVTVLILIMGEIDIFLWAAISFLVVPSIIFRVWRNG